MSLLHAFGSVLSLTQVPHFLKLAARNPDDFINANRVRTCCLGNGATSPPDLPLQVEMMVANTDAGVVEWNSRNEFTFSADTPFQGPNQNIPDCPYQNVSNSPYPFSFSTVGLSDKFKWAADQFNQCTQWVVQRLASLVSDMRIVIVIGSIVVLVTFSMVYFYYKRPPPMLSAVPTTALTAVPATVLPTMEMDDGISCVVCMEQSRSHVFIPCGHMVTCVNCSLDLTNCPVCRTSIERAMKVYL